MSEYIHLFHLFLLYLVFVCVCSVHLRRANLAQRVYVFCDPAGCRFHHLKLFTSEWSMATGSKHHERHETSERHAVILALWLRFHPFLALETVWNCYHPRPQKLNSTILSRPKTWLNQSELPMGTCRHRVPETFGSQIFDVWQQKANDKLHIDQISNKWGVPLIIMHCLHI